MEYYCCFYSVLIFILYNVIPSHWIASSGTRIIRSRLGNIGSWIMIGSVYPNPHIRSEINTVATTTMKRSAAYQRELERVKRLRTPLTRPQEVLELLKISANYDTNYVVTSTALLEALAEIVVTKCLKWNDDDIHEDDEGLNLILKSKVAWTKPPTHRMDRWLQYCATFEGFTDDSIRVLEAIAMILRNFSYTGANVTIMGYCPSILYSLVAFLVVGAKNPDYRRRQRTKINTTSSTEQESLCTSALQTLVHCVRHLDVTGQQLVADKLFNDMNLHDDDSFGQCLSGRIWGDSLGACWFARRLKDDTMEESIPTSMVLDLSADYLIGVWTIFPALRELFFMSNRSVTLMALELLSEWIGLARVGLVGSVMEEDDTIRPRDNYPIPGLRAVLTQIPDTTLERLVQLLSVPRQGGDAIE